MRPVSASVALCVTAFAACGPAAESPWREGPLGVHQAGLTVSGVSGCSTAAVAGLSAQLVAEQNCLRPGALAPFGQLPHVVAGAAVNAYLEPPAVAALAEAIQSLGADLDVTSAFRTLAQQYLLYQWQGSCGIQIAAVPGSSNHETGTALDVDNHDQYRAALEAAGWTWYGSGDVVHFDFTGAGAVDLRSDSVLAFQRLWNANNPGDPIDADGAWGPQTEARVAASPADGFDVGSTCADSGSDSGGGGATDGGTDGDGADSADPGGNPGAEAYAAKLGDHDAPATLDSGETATVWVEFTNTGGATWTPETTFLATDAPRGRRSVLATPSWPSPSRAAAVGATTPPGATGRFTFDVGAPQITDDLALVETFRLVQNESGWFGDGAVFAYDVRLKAPAAPAPATPGAGGDAPRGCGCQAGAPALAWTAALALLARRRAAPRARRMY